LKKQGIKKTNKCNKKLTDTVSVVIY